MGKITRRWKKPARHPIFILLCRLRKAKVIPAIESRPRTPIRGRNPGGGVGTASFHTLVCRRQPAWTNGPEACPAL